MTEGLVEVVIETISDVEAACRSSSELAADCGFSARSRAELVLIVSELGHNLLRHAGGGSLRLEGQVQEHRSLMTVTAEDCGPGIPDIAQSLTDGQSRDGGLGGGLGAIQRLSDEMEISTGDSGTFVRVRKWGEVAS